MRAQGSSSPSHEPVGRGRQEERERVTEAAGDACMPRSSREVAVHQ